MLLAAAIRFLHSQQLVTPFLHQRPIDFLDQDGAGVLLFIGIEKCRDPIELRFLNIPFQFLEGLVGLARKSHNEGRAKGDAGNSGPDALH